MEYREMPGMHKYGESKTTQLMITSAQYFTSGAARMKFQAI
jgi:hypothetical protein